MELRAVISANFANSLVHVEYLMLKALVLRTWHGTQLDGGEV